MLQVIGDHDHGVLRSIRTPIISQNLKLNFNLLPERVGCDFIWESNRAHLISMNKSTSCLLTADAKSGDAM